SAAGLRMLVPDRLCLAFRLVLSSVRSVLRQLRSFMQLGGHHRRTLNYRRRLGLFYQTLLVHSLALKMVARDRIAAIWVLHLSGARAYREGRKAAAAAIIRDCRRC